MADKKLIDNASATTVDNFYGNKGGADVQIPLATAASVLADSMVKSVALPNDGTPVVIGKVSGTSPCIIMLYERSATGQSAILISVGTTIQVLIGDYFSASNSILKCYIDSTKNITVELNYSAVGTLIYRIIECK